MSCDINGLFTPPHRSFGLLLSRPQGWMLLYNPWGRRLNCLQNDPLTATLTQPLCHYRRNRQVAATAGPTAARNTLQRRQISILAFHVRLDAPLQRVPLINQQKLPALSSHAGHFLRTFVGQRFIVQQGATGLLVLRANIARNRIWRST